jgi:hypothetical protein
VRRRDYPGRLTREQWRALTSEQRRALASRAQSDLLKLWRGCTKKVCRRAQTCSGDAEKCKSRPWLADLRSRDLGRPDYQPSFALPEQVREPWAMLEVLPSA